MMQSHKIIVQAAYDVDFGGPFVDGTREATALLRTALQAKGYTLDAAGDQSLADAAWILFYDAPSVNPYGGWRGPDRWLRARLAARRGPRNMFRSALEAGLQDHMALFLWEPPSTTPENYAQRLHTRFPLVFTWHDGLVDGGRYRKIVYPQLSQWPEIPGVPFREKKLLVNISANKMSLHPRQLYSARRAAIRHFERRRPTEFDLYGWGWDYLPMGVLRELWPRPVHRYPSYRGSVRWKWEVMPYYRFSLCYENIRDESGYVTEKIFDSMRCGCVPIYWGASNVETYVSPEAFVDRRRFDSDADLEYFISDMSEVEHRRYLEAIRGYLNSEAFGRFSPQVFVDTVMDGLGL
jgi:alpha(1,3/1,4) fucosyltransferase